MNERSMASFRRTYERSLSKKDQRPRFISRQQLERSRRQQSADIDL